MFSVKTTDHITFFFFNLMQCFMLDQVGDLFVYIFLFLSAVAEDWKTRLIEMFRTLIQVNFETLGCEPSVHSDGGFTSPSKWTERHLPQRSSNMRQKHISLLLCSDFLFVFFCPSNSRIWQELLKSQYFLLAAGKYLSNLSLGSVIFHMS